MKFKIKAIRAYIYKNDLFKGCSNGGISERYDEVFVVCEDGNWEFDENDLPENLVKVVTRNIFGKEHKHAEPYASVSEGHVGWMSGGSVVYSSDARFGAPLSLHDRQESYELFNSFY